LPAGARLRGGVWAVVAPAPCAFRR